MITILVYSAFQKVSKTTIVCKNLEVDRKNGILLPELFWLTERKNWSSDREKLLKFDAEGQ